MKIKEGFKLRTVMGSSVIIAEGISQMNFNKLVSLNESAALMWRKAEGRDFNADDLAQALMDEYEIDADTARADADAVLAKWIEIGLVEQ